MASYHLIDAHLAKLRRRLVWRPDVDDVIAEAEDHLLSAIEAMVADGTSSEAAQREVLDRFGDPATVATAHATSGTAGLAVPTRFTRLAGGAAVAGAALWVLFATLSLVDEAIGRTGAADAAIDLLAAACLIGAALSTLVLVVGLHRRHGGLGPAGVVGSALVGAGVVATLLFWFVMGWGLLLAVGLLLVAAATRSRRLAPTAATMALGSAWVVGVITWSGLRALEPGTPDRWGDYPIVSPIAITVAVAILVPGLVGLGRWLTGEVPVDVDRPKRLQAT